jgi:hypothetical protein
MSNIFADALINSVSTFRLTTGSVVLKDPETAALISAQPHRAVVPAGPI